jgi:hypothetical protein
MQRLFVGLTAAVMFICTPVFGQENQPARTPAPPLVDRPDQPPAPAPNNASEPQQQNTAPAAQPSRQDNAPTQTQSPTATQPQSGGPAQTQTLVGLQLGILMCLSPRQLNRSRTAGRLPSRHACRKGLHVRAGFTRVTGISIGCTDRPDTTIGICTGTARGGSAMNGSTGTGIDTTIGIGGATGTGAGIGVGDGTVISPTVMSATGVAATRGIAVGVGERDDGTTSRPARKLSGANSD